MIIAFVATKVRFHLSLIQGYFAWINALLVGITRVPLPEGKQISDEEFKEIASILLLQIGITLDHETNGLLAHLETLIVDSVYRLDLNRPGKSMTRKGMFNRDMGSNSHLFYVFMGSDLKPNKDEFTETRRVKIPCMRYTGEPLAAYSADFAGKNAALKDKNRLLVNIFGDIWKCYAGPTPSNFGGETVGLF